MPTQLEFDLPEREAQRAADHADAVVENWSDRAYAFVEHFARSGRKFRAEQVREYAEQNGLEPPPDKRAWGAVMIRAIRRDKIIEYVEHMKCSDRKSHNCQVAVWRGRA